MRYCSIVHYSSHYCCMCYSLQTHRTVSVRMMKMPRRLWRRKCLRYSHLWRRISRGSVRWTAELITWCSFGLMESVRESDHELHQSTSDSDHNLSLSLSDPEQLVHHILSDLHQTKKRKSRLILRMLPVSGTCKAFHEDMEKFLSVFLERWFRAPMRATYQVRFKARNSSHNKRDEVINAVAGTAAHSHYNTHTHTHSITHILTL